MREYLLDCGVADMVYQLEHTKPGERVGRIERYAQKRERIFDVRGFRESDSAELAERNPVFAKLNLEIERMRAGAKKDGDFMQRHAFIAQLCNALGDET